MNDITSPYSVKTDHFAVEPDSVFKAMAANLQYASDLGSLARAHANRTVESLQSSIGNNQNKLKQTSPAFTPYQFTKDLEEYWTDLVQRQVLFLDVLRERGNNFIEHEEGDTRPVLAFDYDVIIDGSDLQRPVNYDLVRIRDPEGRTPRESARPYVIIDPRAGHGSGIGGFKDESEVGAALRAGHPVYFAIFKRDPEPGQTISDVCNAEADFVREVGRRHPDAPKPIVIGNCQGGWAAMLLAATNPDITGPVVANGAPLSYWAGTTGKNPMRYLGGICGGVYPVMLLSDLNGGRFDGANLVLNFEMANPGNTWWSKYYNLHANVDKEASRFLDFERWWSSFYYMNEDEIRWIVDNLFVGNKLARGYAQLDERRHIDLRNIQSPIIIFASHGDNITPPQQALNWIADNYTSVDEIRTHGQRILYTLHDSIGHLGIFVSSNIAAKQHTEIVSTLKAIEALSPGLYEMVIKDERGEGASKEFTVDFEERDVKDLLALDDGRSDETAFATVARLSDLGREIYDLGVRPFVKAMVNPWAAKLINITHPLRLPRYLVSNRNPWLATTLPAAAKQVRSERKPARTDNPFLIMEQLGADLITQWWNNVRDFNEFWIEQTFHTMYGSPAARLPGMSMSRYICDAPMGDLRSLVNVQEALDRIDEGGFQEGVIRMLTLLARVHGSVRRSRLERANRLLETEEPFASMKSKHRTRLVYRESLIVNFEPEQALANLPKLIHTPQQRRNALAMCYDVAGPAEEMSDEVVDMFRRIAAVLEVESPLPETSGNRVKLVSSK